MDEYKVQGIARVCHEANRAYCRTLGDKSQLTWDDAPEWQRQSAINGVITKLDNPTFTPKDMHNSWMMQKTSDGWVYGIVKCADKKTHPCMVEYEELPKDQRVKDKLFSVIVEALK
jgi:hypothetical protein